MQTLAKVGDYTVVRDVNANVFLLFPGGQYLADSPLDAAKLAPQLELRRALIVQILDANTSYVDGEAAFGGISMDDEGLSECAS